MIPKKTTYFSEKAICICSHPAEFHYDDPESDGASYYHPNHCGGKFKCYCRSEDDSNCSLSDNGKAHIRECGCFQFIKRSKSKKKFIKQIQHYRRKYDVSDLDIDIVSWLKKMNVKKMNK